MHAVSVWYIGAGVNCDHITKADTQVATNDLVHANLHVVELITLLNCEGNTDSVSTLLTYT